VRQETIMKAIIVGGGIMGLATAWALARDGHEVELLEQGALPNPLASSMDEHRLIRHPYGDRRGYARMIDDAYAAWDLLWTDLGQRLYAPTGTLALTGNGETWAARSAEALAGIGKPMTELRLADLPRRFPQLDTKDVERAFWIDTGGVLFAQDIVTALARHLAQTPGVRLHPHAPVRSVDLERARVVVESGAARALPQSAQGLRALAHQSAESLLLHRDGRRTLRRREAGRQGLGDVALLRSWLQVRRSDGTGTRPHDCRGPRSGCPCTLGGRSGRR
jgi:2-polyprenyl-6-methoxyphenol hydroxylase-like FAD-dependent oxidoreductase